MLLIHVSITENVQGPMKKEKIKIKYNQNVDSHREG
jgi:hypothetical protein